MLAIQFLVYLLLAVRGFSYDYDDDYDDDDYYQPSRTIVSYEGLRMECERGCGDLGCDPDMGEIDRLFQETINTTINCYTGVVGECDEWVEERPLWKREDVCIYEALDWHYAKEMTPNRRGVYGGMQPHAAVSLETHEDFRKAEAMLKEALWFHSRQVVSFSQKHIQQNETDIAILNQFKKEGCFSFHRDEYAEGELRPYAYPGCGGPIDGELVLLDRANVYFRTKLLEEDGRCDRLCEKAGVALREIDAIYKRIFLHCLSYHQSEGIAFHGAIENLIIGEFEEALEKIRLLSGIAQDHRLGDQVLSKIYLLQGQVQSEFGLYGDAIIALTQAIHKNPSLKEAYLERAGAYFELGNFDQALQDYLDSGYRDAPQEYRLQREGAALIGLGIAGGIAEGAGQALAEFGPEVLRSLRGMGNGLWAFCKDPVGASQKFTAAATACVEYLKQVSTMELLQELVPELRELIERYDSLDDLQKGRLIGLSVGKYGVELFMGRCSAKVAASFWELRKANRLMTLEAMASPQQKAEVLAQAAKHLEHRQQVLAHANLKIQWDKQGKHIEGHRNYNPKIGKSIFTHPDPERLAREYAGTGAKAAPQVPGMPGYKEIVDFGEPIGFVVTDATGERRLTNLGKIHYAKGGIHIVPYGKTE